MIKYIFWLNLLFINLLLSEQKLEEKTIDTKINIIDNYTSKIDINFNLKPDEYIYYNSINISVDSPNIELSPWSSNITPSKIYDPIFKDVLVFNQNFTLSLETKIKNELTKNENLVLSYLSNKNKYPIDLIIPLSSDKLEDDINSQNITTETSSKQNEQIYIPKILPEKQNIWFYIQKLSSCAQDIIKKSTSLWIRLIFIFILGLLMSLTPCIYPMIPITVGILQAQSSKSMLNNALITFAYAFGIATTFAIFGLIAAFTGHLFGKILIHPIFVIFIITFFVYMALSMFGLYEMYIPKFLNNQNNNFKGGSLISAFMFGAISGSIASPCLSPGLALLLTIVATLANKFLGFLFLFVFGIGLSVPLIIIGLFSSSINVLPKSGMWMVEVKKLFGFMLFGMCFYFLNNILPYNILLWLISFFVLGSGIYYLTNIYIHDSKFWKRFKNLLGIILIASSIVIFVKAIQETFYSRPKENDIWLNNYDDAKKEAILTNKKLLIDIGAEFCTLCKAIDKHIFSDPQIKKSLEKFVTVKVDATNTEKQPYPYLKEKYKIMGVPTILIIDPNTEDLIKFWGGELYDLQKNQIINELERLNNI